MNEKNLIPLNKRTKSEQREITQKGGKASGVARGFRAAAKKRIRENPGEVDEVLEYVVGLIWGDLEPLGADVRPVIGIMALGKIVGDEFARALLDQDKSVAVYLHTNAAYRVALHVVVVDSHPVERAFLHSDVWIDPERSTPRKCRESGRHYGHGCEFHSP